jgi:excisionase family DNA binding protein
MTVSVEEAAGLLGISRALAYELVRRGELPRLRLGRRVVIPRKALREFVEASTTSTSS